MTNDDIVWAETILGNGIIFDTERRNTIRSMDSVDIQASPGSGKTTALIAKLAILAKKWPTNHVGICVLSHTNVARDEIEKRLGKTEIGSRLLSYPHFMGTIHNFFNTYVAIPWLRSNGYWINIIDTEIAKKYRWNKLSWNTKEFLKRKFQDENLCCFKSSIGDIGWDKYEEKKKEIIKEIFRSQEEGIFTYDEMLLYAQQALDECDSIPVGIQTRFPLVFIDEAQDTNSMQWNLIHTAFPEGSVVRQGFGDCNQAIYNYADEGSGNVEFPRANPMLICGSLRFDDRIATLANTVAVSGVKMHGTDNELSRCEKQTEHTVFLFQRNKDSSSHVISEYGKLLLSTFTDDEICDNQEKGCHVLGMVHVKKEDTPESHFPKGVFDYWPFYDADKTNKNFTPRSMIEFYRRGLSEYETSHEYNRFVANVLQGVRQLINKSKKEKFIPVSGNPLASMLKRLPEEKVFDFRKKLLDVVTSEIHSKEQWETISSKLNEILDLFNSLPNKSTIDFLHWKDENALVSTDQTDVPKLNDNCYLYRDDVSKRSVVLQFGSVHSEKGRTHLSTLIVETFTRAHNMKSIIRYLCGDDPKKTPMIEKKLRVHYVAMTRAKGLLCLAIPEEFVNDNARQALMALGWKICIVD